MDFHNKKVKRIFSIIIIVVIAAMVLTGILPWLV